MYIWGYTKTNIFFSMFKKLSSIALHTAGATVQTETPFAVLKSFDNGFELSNKFINKWVAPYYIYIGGRNQEWIDKLAAVKHEITNDVIEKCLGNFDWRTRQTGAFFAAITNKAEFIDIIGTHLLKSEVCYAGKVYCEVLASFNLPVCVDYLNCYLAYYLKRPELYFEQQRAMEAIRYLDKINSTNHFETHAESWKSFIKDKPYWQAEVVTFDLEQQVHIIQTLRQSAG